MKPIIRVYPDKASLDRAAALLVVELLGRAHAARRAPASLALSGGTTPRGLYELLASPEFSSRIPWPDIDIFWTDERCVPPEHPDSNYGMAKNSLLSKVPVAEANIHRIHGELEPERATRDYEARLRRFGRGCDVVLLGIGDDGHTASLFPNTAALNEMTAWAAAVSGPRGQRVTMTFPYLELSGDVLVLACGSAKAEVVASATRGSYKDYPIQRLRTNKPALWLVDHEASAGL